MLGLDAKRAFFDRPAVINAVDKATLRTLSRFGAFVRRRARSSIRFRKRVSAAGSPPSSHSKSEPNIRTILFAYDKSNRSVVIGPLRFNGKRTGIKATKGTVPELLEEGGEIAVEEVQLSGGLWTRPNRGLLRLQGQRPRRTRRATIKARPFMGPAFAYEKIKAAGLYKDEVK